MGKKWTSKDETKLLTICKQEREFKHAEIELGRTESAIKARIYKLGAGYYTAKGIQWLKPDKTKYGKHEPIAVVSEETDLILNTQQQAVYDEVMHGKSKVIILTGKAGTGKSAVTAKIVKDFKGGKAVTSSTNKAKENLAQMCGLPGSTIHSYAGFILQKEGYNMILRRRGNHSPERVKLLVIDEAPMTPKEVYDFVLQLQTDGTIGKILLVGDDVQLEAVGTGINLSTLDSTYINPAAPPITRIELTQQMRQSDSHPEVQRYLDEVRLSIESKTDKKEDVPLWPQCPDITFTDSYKEFAKAYSECTTDKKCIAYRNSVVNKMNLNINNAEDMFNVGDDLVIDSPIDRNTKNGAIVKVLSVREDTEYDKTILEVITPYGSTVEVDHWHTKTAFEAELHKAKSLGDEGLYWYLKDRHVGVKHLFASTVHKAQGSSYTTVFVDVADIWAAYVATPSKWNNPITLNACMRLIYVALSRMRSKAVCFVGNVRKYELLSR